ncbi:MAG TPA: hypothetical protein VHU17_09810 [Acidimicrobiales bacterium]|jgi:hypothetical protein|nr:hypothetical protein [Acidimicrobiales bacterium]
MSHRHRVAAKFAIGLAVLIPAIGVLPGVASAGEYKFHAHINAYAKPACSGFQWSNEAGLCDGKGEAINDSSGNSFPFSGGNTTITIRWSSAPSLCGYKPMPAGYNRWMKVNTNDGYWLCGAVKSNDVPNGSFVVVEGKTDHGSVKPSSSDASTVEKPGGPLFLWVGYHGQDSYGYGYVFGLRGYVSY